MFTRKIYQQLLNWKIQYNGRAALLIEGARRVGKSTVVEEFARNEYKSYILIDFSIASQDILDLFDDISDLDYIFLQLQLQFRTELFNRESVIIFDEVQLCPKARQAIKHLVKDYRYDYIETGSLISIKKNTKNILIPSEEHRINMYPMDFEEFLWATGDHITNKLLETAFTSFRPLDDATHRKIMRTFRLYMLVGGMPQAIACYIDTNNLMRVDALKRDIIKLYADDMKKLDSTGRMSMLYNAIPAQLQKNTSRYNVSSILKNERAASIMPVTNLLQESKTVLLAYHANEPGAGMSGNIDINKYKMFLNDTGLFTTLMFMDSEFADNDLYKKLLSDKTRANLGYLYENVTAQILTSNGYKLFYHTFPKENSRLHYEIDFLLPLSNKVCPLEIKSSSYKSHSSLDAFSKKYPSKIAERYIVYTKNLYKEQDIKYIPIYMLQFI